MKITRIKPSLYARGSVQPGYTALKWNPFYVTNDGWRPARIPHQAVDAIGAAR